MKQDLFFEQFNLLADAPNGVQKLRELILQLAVQGKLVSQDEGDEPASVLLEKIFFEKVRLVRGKKIKDFKPLPRIKADEVPFCLPQNWEWVHLQEVANAIHYGYTASANQNLKDVRLLRITDIQNNTVNWKTVPGCKIEETKLPQYQLNDGDLLIARTGGTIGKSYLVDDSSVCAIFASYLIRIVPTVNDLSRYIKLFLESELYWKQLHQKSMGTGQPNVNATSLKSLLFPLPPSAEQKRIVTKVDELMGLCDELEKRQEKRQRRVLQLGETATAKLITPNSTVDFERDRDRIFHNFDLIYSTPKNVIQLRQAILQLAVMGKLVPQDATDEPASVLLEKIQAEKARLVKEGKIKKSKQLPAFDVNEVGYQLPKTWQWIRLSDIISLMDAGWSPACEKHPTQNQEQWGVLKTTAVQKLSYIQEEHKELPEKLKPRPEYEVKAGDILITRAGPKNRVGICCLVKETRPKLMISDKIIRFHLVDDNILPDFAVITLNAGFSNYFIETQKSGMAESQMNIAQTKLRMTPISLPALAEQKRIVTKVNQLMSLCDDLESQLSQALNDREKLLETAVHQLLAA